MKPLIGICILGLVFGLVINSRAENWVSWAMMGYERPAQERIEDNLEKIEQLVEEIRKLNRTVPRQLEKIAP